MLKVIHAPSAITGIAGVSAVETLPASTGDLVLKLLITALSALPTVINLIQRKKQKQREKEENK